MKSVLLAATLWAALCAAEEPDAGAPDAGLQRETTVRAERVLDPRRIAGSASVIGREELERNEQNDIHQVLKGVPGVYAREEDGFGLRPNIGLRGVSPDRSAKVTLMEDGVLFGPAPYSAPAAYYFPMATRMTAVEVYKGPAAIRFGPNTIGGAVNLRTRDVPTQGFEADLDASLGSYFTAKGHGVIGWGNDRFGVLAEVVHLQSDGFKQLDNGGPTGFNKNEGMLKARLALPSKGLLRHELRFKVGLSEEESNETYLGISEGDFAKTPLRRYAASQLDLMHWTRSQVEASHLLRVGDSVEVLTTFYRHDFARTWKRVEKFRSGPALFELLDGPGTGASAVYLGILRGEQDSETPGQAIVVNRNHRGFVSQGVQSIGRWKATFGPVENELEVGVRFHNDEIRRRHTEEDHVMQSGVLVPDGRGEKDALVNLAATRALALHAQDVITFGPVLLAPGARVEVIDSFYTDYLAGPQRQTRQVIPVFGVGAVANLPAGFSLLAGVHQGFSPVSPGQPIEVQAERAINYEFGARFSRWGIKAEAIGFVSDYSNLTGECTFSSGCPGGDINRQYDGGAALLTGLEATASARVKGPWSTTFFGDLSYTLSVSSFKTAFTSDNPIWGSVQEGYSLPYVPTHQGSAKLRGRRGPLEIGVGVTVLGEMREIAGAGDIDPAVKVGTRVTLDATATYEFTDSARLYLTGANLLNQTQLVARRPFGARPMAPLMVNLGFKYAFR